MSQRGRIQIFTALWVGAAAMWPGDAGAQSARPGMGSMPYADAEGTGVTFRVWAPNATNVAVRGDFNDWTETAMAPESGGRWSVDVPGAEVGQQYRYRINGELNRRDPRSRRVTNSGSNGNSVIYDPHAFDWQDTPVPMPPRKDTVIYQMHIGTFGGSTTPRTFDDAIERLDHVQGLGISAIKIMPVNEFAGNQSWGYNPADPFAIESAYGGPDAFKRFVRACHERGIAVFVDVVHNHYGPSDLHLWRFDGWYQNNLGGIYFYNDARAHTMWGSTRPDYGRSEVRSFIRDQIMMFVDEYRVGGFRWDSVYSIIYSDQGHNQAGEHMLRDINWELVQNRPHVQRIAEDNAFDFSMNFQSQWDVSSRWALHGQVTTSADANRNMFTVRNLLRDWASLNRIVFIEAHDYVASNHNRTRLPSQIDLNNNESIWARKRSLLAAGIVMTAPGVPMIFQGQEMLETQAFHDNVPLRWDRTNTFAGIVRAYADLIHARRNLNGGTKGLQGTGINVHHVDNNNKVIAYIRWDAGGQSDDVVVVANFANQVRTNNTYSIAFPSDGVWYSHYNSDSTDYQDDFGNIGSAQVVVSGGSGVVNMGRYSLQIFSKEAPFSEPEGPALPSVATGPAVDTSDTSVSITGEVTDDGGAEVIERGVVWNSSGMPTTNDLRVTAGVGVGSFTNELVDLTTGQLHFARAYAVNEVGPSYGNQVTFTPGVQSEDTPPLQLVGGVVVFEAEDYAFNLSPRSDHAWVFTNDVTGYSGEGFLQGLPDDNFVFSNWETTSPELQFPIVFNSATTHYVWVRAYGHDANSDSVHWGLNGAPQATQGINWPVYNEWVWTNRVTVSTVATLNVTSTGTNLFQLWIREDGARIDRVAIVTNANFRPRKGNAWHIPHSGEPAGQYAMRMPHQMIFTNTAVTIFSGNQFQGGGNAGDQVQTGSTIYYKAATGTVWQTASMSFHSTVGNNKYYSGVIPPDQFAPGEVVQYYLRIPYNDFLPTFLHQVGGTHQSTEDEDEARANPYTYVVRHMPESGHPSPDDWRDINIYQIFTDRFYDGDPSNNTAHPGADYEPAAGNRIHGGDFKGIEKKLDYIKALGANAIWIKPIQLNAGQGAYHGYHAQNFYELAPNLGTIDDLRSMVSAAHARDIYVILDIVVNHQARRIDSGDAGFPAYNADGYNLRWTTGETYDPPFNQLDHFHNHGNIQNWSDPVQLVRGDLNGLDDLKTETRHVRTNMVDIFSFWIELGDLDGFRIDTVKHVEIGFWEFFNNEIRAFAQAMGKTNFIQFGEVFDTTESGNGYFTGTQAGRGYANDTVLNFPLYGVVNSVFAQASGNTRQIENHYNAITNHYHPDARMRLINFLDNHDVYRFMHPNNANNNTNRLAVALSFLYSARGIPNLYYGTEQHFNGGEDPANREDMFAGQYEQGPSLGDNFDMTKGSYLHVARLNNFRRLYPSLRTGEHLNRWNNPSGPGLFSYARRLGDEEVFVVFNTAGSTHTLTNRNTIYAPGTVMVNLFNTNETITVTAGGTTPPIDVPGTSYKMFVGESYWQPLDPVVQAQLPAHAAQGVSVTGSIVLTFSQRMDIDLTQAAFQIDPPATGTFAWNVNQNVLTFTPAGPTRLADQTRYVVRITEGAVSEESGNAFYAPFETFFDTGAATDSDGDGLPDWWEGEHFGGPTNAVASQLAANGVNTLLEAYIAGLNPHDSSAVFRITFSDPATVALSSIAGRWYDVEARTGSNTSWDVILSNAPGTGGELSVPVSASPPSRWYRGLVRLPSGP